jgi:hypothetical protein
MVTFLHLMVKIALAVCGRCGHRARVLPCDALPHKTFGAAAIELVMAEYSEGRRSLRQVAWAQLGERTPAHTSLHGWTEGFGLHALGRDGLLGAMRWSRLLEEGDRSVSENCRAGVYRARAQSAALSFPGATRATLCASAAAGHGHNDRRRGASPRHGAVPPTLSHLDGDVCAGGSEPDIAHAL